MSSISTKGIEKADACTEDKINAQLVLLRLASSSNDSKISDKKPENFDELQQSLEDFTTIVKYNNLYDSLSGSGRSLKWCCALSLYCSMRAAARLDQMHIDLYKWNSIVRRVVIEMMGEDKVSMGSPNYNILEKDAYSDIGVIDRIVDDCQGTNTDKMVEYLAHAFGCGYRADALRLFTKVFTQNIERCFLLRRYYPFIWGRARN